jgi:DNA repair exonuclease SbcCD ATPase subunit
VAGKQTFFERPDNEKEFSQDDMSLKDDRNYKNFQFGEEPYVPVAVAKKHISMMEADMRRMKENYGKTMKDLEAGYLKLEETTRQIYKRTLGVWKSKAKNKIKQFQEALKKAIQERNEIETNLKERLKKTRIERERLDKEKIFLLSENEAGREQIQEKARLLEEIKNTYKAEIKEKENIIDQREEQIEKMKDEQELIKAKIEAERQALVEQNQKDITEVKLKLENETSKREQLEVACQKLQEEGAIPAGAIVPIPVSRQGTRTK